MKKVCGFVLAVAVMLFLASCGGGGTGSGGGGRESSSGVRGQLYSPDGSKLALSEIKVELYETASGRLIGVTTSNASGAFEIVDKTDVPASSRKAVYILIYLSASDKHRMEGSYSRGFFATFSFTVTD